MIIIIIIIMRLYYIYSHIFSCGIIIRISDGPLFVTEMKKNKYKNAYLPIGYS
jgi:hypothetical protein